MKLVDLTLRIPPAAAGKARVVTGIKQIRQADGVTYDAVVYDFAHDSMTGTYLDFPGHIRDTDDGANAANYPLAKLFRVETSVIHLDRADGSGAVTAAELTAACPAPGIGGGLVVNALGARRFDDIRHRSVWLSSDAVQWIAEQGVHLLVSDIYESPGLHGVFGDLFRRHVLTVCLPVNLHLLTSPRVRLTVLCPAFENVTQLPCRVVAEVED